MTSPDKEPKGGSGFSKSGKDEIKNTVGTAAILSSIWQTNWISSENGTVEIPVQGIYHETNTPYMLGPL